MSLYRFSKLGAILVLPLLAACSSMLPKSNNESASFQNFDEARKAIESLVPLQSDLGHLSKLGIDPFTLPNTLILSYPDLVRRFAPGNVLSKNDLDPGIVTCLNARHACRGWELKVERISRVRTGGFFSDFLNFSRRTESSGWRFNALILMVDGTVVYRAWGGQPLLNSVEVQKNPLGPLQNIGTSVVTEF
ncbi:MAG: hypothetical protein WBI20_14200 [Burkholderiaceae bacterium]